MTRLEGRKKRRCEKQTLKYVSVSNSISPKVILIRENSATLDVLSFAETKGAISFELDCGHAGVPLARLPSRNCLCFQPVFIFTIVTGPSISPAGQVATVSARYKPIQHIRGILRVLLIDNERQ
ncbi:hypothetical protein TcasGA2_TC012201 [Tribolium castaneum]|uniref:Uncharacterized protein n=1 Tax=Tribolium castaneum TaxID=7070 RepID=D6X085_TRICA|nr:hypothetical protein TcasGA2_TC012201 [Tribolium castaneum]